MVTTILGDADIKATEFKTQSAKLEPLLRLFPKSPHMCITNDDLKDVRGNGTDYMCVKVKLKARARTNRQWKIGRVEKFGLSLQMMPCGWSLSIDQVHQGMFRPGSV